jgi:hypothetical protein
MAGSNIVFRPKIGQRSTEIGNQIHVLIGNRDAQTASKRSPA